MNVELWGVLVMAFSLGMLHALDADHVIAITGLNCQQPDKKNSLLFCARWAFGHGGTLLLIGGAVMFLGMAIPERLSAIAENLVGVALIAIGVMVLLEMYRQCAHRAFHRQSLNNEHQHSHAPVLVGVLHGVAGSAPLLALLPLSQMTSPWRAMSYLLLFGLGVFIAMLIFGGVIGQVFGWLKSWGNNFVNALRLTISFLSIAYGVKLVAEIF